MSRPKKFTPFGNDLFGDAIQQKTDSPLKQKFLFPPFSVLNSREGAWQERKAAWLAMGIQSEVGRGNNHLGMSDTVYAQSAGLITGSYDKSKIKEIVAGLKKEDEKCGTSIFDPVLCELSYDWFCQRGGQILDPFCGGSVRGIVAACMGRRYWGGDLRQEQIDANVEQGMKIVPDNLPQWICGDSNETVESAPLADFVFSCPPYADLEVYSDDPADLSTMDYDGFIEVYRSIIFKACARLKPNRFAAFVVGDVRDKKTGMYRNFHGATIQAFIDAGLGFYNDCILINAVGTLALRVTRQFEAGRKLGKSHQNLLVFVKGDWRKAADSINNPVAIPPRRK